MKTWIGHKGLLRGESLLREVIEGRMIRKRVKKTKEKETIGYAE